MARNETFAAFVKRVRRNDPDCDLTDAELWRYYIGEW